MCSVVQRHCRPRTPPDFRICCSFPTRPVHQEVITDDARWLDRHPFSWHEFPRPEGLVWVSSWSLDGNVRWALSDSVKLVLRRVCQVPDRQQTQVQRVLLFHRKKSVSPHCPPHGSTYCPHHPIWIELCVLPLVVTHIVLHGPGRPIGLEQFVSSTSRIQHQVSQLTTDKPAFTVPRSMLPDRHDVPWWSSIAKSPMSTLTVRHVVASARSLPPNHSLDRVATAS